MKFYANVLIYHKRLQNFLHNSGQRVSEDLKNHFFSLKMIACSWLECDYGFSCVSLIIRNTILCLLIVHVSNLMLIKIDEPRLQIWTICQKFGSDIIDQHMITDKARQSERKILINCFCFSCFFFYVTCLSKVKLNYFFWL